jgi:hypothetical protein|tara:strand:- start:2375 stop:2716 length:342 start_codon:yes stop_codon:yes gene_type:complete
MSILLFIIGLLLGAGIGIFLTCGGLATLSDKGWRDLRVAIDEKFIKHDHDPDKQVHAEESLCHRLLELQRYRKADKAAYESSSKEELDNVFREYEEAERLANEYRKLTEGGVS